ncbi:glycosyltransferase family 1 protein [Bacillus cereus]|uniref:glycosyltransferase family 1 protein n=1 Tax=Bacillus cereus TaxID=1396 RepID=UPI0028530437|nr:glycosyltransferase family 1 protein [Bacillus cereus]MDR4983676.1 glycosyltransferase family 1 protein [Bacillus cereus]MEA1011315.1 glycosyltransferase family 1 protein [Bacillus cereus]
MEHPLRVLHVVVNMNRGGAETLLMNLYRNLDRSKIQFDFLTCKEGIFDEEIVELGGRVHRIPYITDVGHTGYMKALDKFFSSYQEYKIVHSHMDKMSGFVLRSAKKAGILIRIAHSHNTQSEGGLAARAYKWYAGKSILTCATHLLACSNAAARWLFADQANTAEILKNGIECDKFVFAPEIRRQVKEELQLHQDTFVVGHVGRFAHQKNHSFLIDVFVQLLKYKPNSILLLAGDGPLRLEFEKKIKTLSLQNSIKILGVRSDIERLMQVFDVFVFPSYHEGLPVTLIEAQGAGLPCIISDAITREVDLNTGLTNFQSINSFPGVWAREILKVNNRIQNAKGMVRKGGYDIKESAIWIENFYHNIS